MSFGLERLIYYEKQIKESNETNKTNETNETNVSQSKEKIIKYNKKYLEIAKSISELSYASRKKVGAIIVKDNSIISDGYNGTPNGFENECEDNIGNTKWYTLHAEANAITKLVRIGGVSANGSTLYTTVSPCKECAKLILQSGIKKVIYNENYRDTSGIDFLKKAGICIECIE
jgi:dCMP deaminase